MTFSSSFSRNYGDVLYLCCVSFLGQGHKLPQSRGLNTQDCANGQRAVPSGGSEGKFHTSLQLPVLPTILGFLACGPISPVSKEACHMAGPLCLLCVSVSECPFSCEDTTHWFWAHSSPLRPHLNLITSAETLYPNRVTFTGAGTWGRTSVVFG